ncbi:hypothetical protein [Actinocorallia libanotica]|uniref:PD-(D/E)XK nuclease superfamily protein n=1 Tax=Actinocorallia libanotica TaxID=46162 RepID=A0ABN1RY26_9ACTN
MNSDDRDALYEILYAGPMFQRWHWYRWNFQHYLETGRETEFARRIMDSLLRCNAVMPGIAAEMLDRMARMSGRDRDMADYQQLLQWLSELLVIDHLVQWEWKEEVTFIHEPKAPGGKKNPEILVKCESFRLGVEVKCPVLDSLQHSRASADLQLLARLPRELTDRLGKRKALPRDNPLKDYLISSQQKFEKFHETDPDFHGVLFVVWDDYVNEPISALLSSSSGLFTERSFHRTEDNRPHPHPAVDAVVLIRHQHQFINAAAGRPLRDDRRHVLDYGSVGRFPFNALIINPRATRKLPAKAVESLQARTPCHHMGAEYVPSELVFWQDTNRSPEA